MPETVRRTGNAVRARGLTKTFRRKKETVEAVKGVDIDVAQGELVAVLGPNGAGKSTTIRMLTSVLRPTSGTAEVAGCDVVRHPADVRARIGYVGQGNAGGYSYRSVTNCATRPGSTPCRPMSRAAAPPHSSRRSNSPEWRNAR